MTTKRITSLVAFASLALLALPVAAEPQSTSAPSGKSKTDKQSTADWHKDPECQAVFFTVLEGLYRDGISKEIVDTVIGKIEENKLEKSFVFRCKLCHACYEAFALYQRRPAFHGTKGRKTLGHREISKEVVQDLRSDNVSKFNEAFAKIVQPWIKADLKERLARGEDGLELMKKYVKLAEEGDKLRTAYLRCQACDAIGSIAKAMEEEKKKEKK